MGRQRVALLLGAAGIALTAAFAGHPGDRSLAVSDGTPTPLAMLVPLADRPARIVEGTCDKPGKKVSDLTSLAAPSGDAVGPDRSVIAEGSFTAVPATLASLVDEPHALLVGYSEDQPGRVLACGAIGGIYDNDGALVIGLTGTQPAVHGVAYLFPGQAGDTTGVSAFLSAGFTAGEARNGIAGTPVAVRPTEVPPGASVDVSVREGEIVMPKKALAGIVTFTITNDGTEEHAFDLTGEGIEVYLDFPLKPGETGSLSVNLPPGEYTVTCPVNEGVHAEQGETATLTVE